jgi:hypothetical protein
MLSQPSLARLRGIETAATVAEVFRHCTNLGVSEKQSRQAKGGVIRPPPDQLIIHLFGPFEPHRVRMPIGTTNSLAQPMAEAARLTVERQDEFLVAVAARYYASRVGVPVGFSDSELKQLMAEAAR